MSLNKSFQCPKKNRVDTNLQIQGIEEAAIMDI